MGTVATVSGALICPQGHGPGLPETRFCRMCGTALVTPLAAAPPPATSLPDTASAQPVASTAAVSMPASRVLCQVCGGAGANLDAAEDVCSGCGWLRPLLPGYQLDRSVFLWAQDGQAMTRLQKIPAVHAAVRAASDKVGRPWIESTFNGIRLGPRQLPAVWKQAILA